MLGTTALIPSDCIAYRPNFSAQWRDELERVLCGLQRSEQGQNLLKEVFRAERFESGDLEVYEAIPFGDMSP